MRSDLLQNVTILFGELVENGKVTSFIPQLNEIPVRTSLCDFDLQKETNPFSIFADLLMDCILGNLTIFFELLFIFLELELVKEMIVGWNQQTHVCCHFRIDLEVSIGCG